MGATKGFPMFTYLSGHIFYFIFGRGANCICLDFYLFSFAHLKSVGLPLQLIIKVGTVCWKLGDLRSADNAATPNFCFYT